MHGVREQRLLPPGLVLTGYFLVLAALSLALPPRHQWLATPRCTPCTIAARSPVSIAGCCALGGPRGSSFRCSSLLLAGAVDAHSLVHPGLSDISNQDGTAAHRNFRCPPAFSSLLSLRWPPTSKKVRNPSRLSTPAQSLRYPQLARAPRTRFMRGCSTLCPSPN